MCTSVVCANAATMFSFLDQNDTAHADEEHRGEKGLSPSGALNSITT